MIALDSQLGQKILQNPRHRLQLPGLNGRPIDWTNTLMLEPFVYAHITKGMLTIRRLIVQLNLNNKH